MIIQINKIYTKNKDELVNHNLVLDSIRKYAA